MVTVRLFFRKVPIERKLRRLKYVKGVVRAGDRVMVTLDRMVSNRELNEIIRLLNSEEWELISPSKSMINYRQYVKESRLKDRR